MRVLGRARLGNVLVGVVVHVPRTLVLVVLLVVVRQVVLPRGRLTLRHFRYVVSQPIVDERVLLDGVDVHVGNGGQVFLFQLSARESAPVGLDSFHVPLVDHCHDVLGLDVVEISEDSLVPLVDEDALLLWGGLAEQSDEEVDATAVDGLCKGLSAPHVEGVEEIVRLAGPAGGNFHHIPETLPEICVKVEVGLKSESLYCRVIEGLPSEYLLRAVVRGVLEGQLGLQAGSEQRKVFGQF